MMRFSAVVLCALCVIALVSSSTVDESKQRLEDIVNKCHESFPDDQKARILCISKKERWQNEDGSINKDLIRQRADILFEDQKKRDEVYHDCTQEKDTPEDTAASIIACYKKHIHIDVGV